MSRKFVREPRPPRPCETCPATLPVDAGRRRRFCDRCREARHPGPKGPYHTMCQQPGCKSPLPDGHRFSRRFCDKCGKNRDWRKHYQKKREAELAVRPPRFCAGFHAPCSVELPNALPPGQRGRLPERCPPCARLHSLEKMRTHSKLIRDRNAPYVGSFSSKGQAQDYLFRHIGQNGSLKLRALQGHGAKKKLTKEAVAMHLEKLIEDGYIVLLGDSYRLK